MKVATLVREGVVYLGERAEPLTATIAGTATAKAQPPSGGAPSQGRRVTFGAVPDFAFEGASELAHFQPTAESRKCFEDLRLSSKVWATLAKDPATRSAGVNVTADGGDVLITGSVGSSKALELIPRIAGEVEGVKAVRCEEGMGADWYW